MRAVIYARVSSQAQKDRHTIASQLATLPDFIARQGWTLVRPADTYVDEGKTAKGGHLEKREGWKRLRCDMEAGIFDVVVVVDQDRLTRSEDLRERGDILGAFQRAGIKIAVASTGQVLDLASSMGDLISTLGAFFSAEENRKRRDRTVRGKVEAARKGRKPAGPTPFGYLYDRTSGAWSVDPELGPIVLEIFTRVAAGESCAAIARDLRARGVSRARPSTAGNRKPGRMNPERVWQIARSRTYLGEWIADKAKGLAVQVPRIVSEELWGSADQALLKFGLRGLNRVKHAYVAHGVIKCALCGGVLGCASARSGARKGGRNFYYVCVNRRRPPEGRGRCTLPMRRVDDVDARVWAAVVDLLDRPDHLVRALLQRGDVAAGDVRDWRAEVKDYERRLAKLEQHEMDIVERYRRELLSSRAFDLALERTAAERALLSRQLETAKRQSAGAEAQRTTVEALLSQLQELRRRVAGATVEERRDLVRALVPGRDEHWIVVGPEEIEIRVLVSAAPSPPIAHLSLAG